MANKNEQSMAACAGPIWSLFQREVAGEEVVVFEGRAKHRRNLCELSVREEGWRRGCL